MILFLQEIHCEGKKGAGSKRAQSVTLTWNPLQTNELQHMYVRVSVRTSASLLAQRVKNLPATQETGVCPLGWEGPLEKGKAAHSSILVWSIPWTEEPGRLQSMGLPRVRYDRATNALTYVSICVFMTIRGL